MGSLISFSIDAEQKGEDIGVSTTTPKKKQ
jgi:hypothetical protein